MKEVVKLVYANGKETEMYYSPYADPRVVALIERYFNTDARVRVFYGDTDRPDFENVHGKKPDVGRDWGEEHEVTGYIGRSTGTKKIPLLIYSKRSYGGGAIMTDCIVRMIVNGHEVYRHPDYRSDFDNAEVVPSELAPEYSHAVVTDNGEVARFKSEKSAKNWLAFMRGERMSK